MTHEAQPNRSAETTEAIVASTRQVAVRWGAVVSFTVLACGLAWLVMWPVWAADPASVQGQLLAGLLMPVMMFTPGIAALLVTFVLRTPRSDRLRALGIWPLRPAKRVVWMSVAAIFGVMAIAFASVGVAVLAGWLEIDLVNFSGFAALNEAALPPGTDLSILPPVQLLVLLQIVLVPIAAIVPNGILALGEELGWRGWLLPALRPMGTWPALVLSGGIWGVWHAPVTLLGHNYGLLDWRGVALMTINCVIWGVLLGWLRLRTASVWPAVFAHGALNGIGGITLLVAAAGPTPRPELATLVGVAGWIVVAAVVVVLALCGQFQKQPELTQPRRGHTAQAETSSASA